MQVFIWLLTVTVLCCSVPFGYKPPAKAGTLASPLKRTQDIITDLGSKNDTPFAKCSALYCQLWAFQTPGKNSILSWPTQWFGKTQSSTIFGVFSVTWVTNCGGCVWLVPALQQSRVWDSFLCSCSWEVTNPSKPACRMRGWEIKEEVPLLLCSLITSLWYQPNCEKFMSPPSACSTELRAGGMTLLNKPQLEAFSQQSTDGVCPALGWDPAGDSSCLPQNQQCSCKGHDPNPKSPTVSPSECRRQQRNKGKLHYLGSAGCVLWNRGRTMDTGDAKVGIWILCSVSPEGEEGIWIPCSVSPEQSGQVN